MSGTWRVRVWFVGAVVVIALASAAAESGRRGHALWAVTVGMFAAFAVAAFFAAVGITNQWDEVGGHE